MSNAVKYTPDGVSSGAEAVEYCTVRHQENRDYYACIIDRKMPEMNGYDAARVIRSMDRAYCKRIPIIAMTANAFAEDVQAARAVGMNEHIAKPLDLKALAKTLRKWLIK